MRLRGALVLFVVLGVLAAAAPAHAATATRTASVTFGPTSGGVVKVAVTSGVPCQFSAVFQLTGETASSAGTGLSFNAEFVVAPRSGNTNTSVSVTCEFDDSDLYADPALQVTVDTGALGGAVDENDDGDDGGSGGLLPGTGGAPWWIAVVGFALLIAGTALLRERFRGWRRQRRIAKVGL